MGEKSGGEIKKMAVYKSGCKNIIIKVKKKKSGGKNKKWVEKKAGVKIKNRLKKNMGVKKNWAKVWVKIRVKIKKMLWLEAHSYK